jgi:hypothetical protein
MQNAEWDNEKIDKLEKLLEEEMNARKNLESKVAELTATVDEQKTLLEEKEVLIDDLISQLKKLSPSNEVIVHLARQNIERPESPVQ